MNWRKPVLFFQRANWNFNWWQYWTAEGLATERAANTNIHATFKKQWSIHFGGTVAGRGEVYCSTCARGGPAVRNDRGIYPWAGFVGDQRPPITPVMFVNYWKRDGGRSESLNLSPEIDYRAGSQFRGSVTANFAHLINDLQTSIRRPIRRHAYLFAHIAADGVDQFRRLYGHEYADPPGHAQPFVSKGKWSNLRELSATPRADSYDARYQSYAGTMPEDFNQQFFNSNVVLRWEYRPGSTLFLVWNQGRQNSEQTMGDRNFTGDFGELFNTRPLNTFLIKMSYWFSR